MNILKSKTCPRCSTRMDKNMVVCPGCQLNFNKFEQATNKEAKQALREGDKDRVLMRKGCPADVSRTKLILLTIFLGFTGAHHYYVGRAKMGAFYSIFFVIGLLNAALQITLHFQPTGNLWDIFTMLIIIWGIVLIMWIFDIIAVCVNRYKIPVSRDE